MKKEIVICDVCGKQARDVDQQREENWIVFEGGVVGGVRIWLKEPRKPESAVSGYMHRVGREDRQYDFCSIKCFVEALEAKESI